MHIHLESKCHPSDAASLPHLGNFYLSTNICDHSLGKFRHGRRVFTGAYKPFETIVLRAIARKGTYAFPPLDRSRPVQFIIDFPANGGIFIRFFGQQPKR